MKKKSENWELNPLLVKILKVVVYALGLFFAGVGTEDTAAALNLLPL